MTLTRGSFAAISSATRPVPSGELSSITRKSHSRSGSTAATMAGRFSRSLYVGIRMTTRSIAALLSRVATRWECVNVAAPMQFLKARYHSRDEFLEAYSRELPYGGLFIPTTTPLAPGAKVVVDLDCDG